MTREMVQAWVDDWDGEGSLDDLIYDKVHELNLEDHMVDTTAHDNLPDEMHLAAMIVRDLPSYLPPPDDATGS